MTLLRYPGSKRKILGSIWPRFPDAIIYELWSSALGWEYREPFFGGGSVGLDILGRLSPKSRVWLNDLDPGIASLWITIRDDPEPLMALIHAFEPTAEAFYTFQAEDGIVPLCPVEAGFRKLVLHRISFSGLGARAGGPIGGKDQELAKYTAGCRWNPGSINKKILAIHKKMARFRSFSCTCQDFAVLIDGAPRECFLYLDPPYYGNGSKLYKHHFSEADHVRLAGMLRECRASWVLSYDDHAAIRELYSWANIESVDVTYTTANFHHGLRNRTCEVIITP